MLCFREFRPEGPCSGGGGEGEGGGVLQHRYHIRVRPKGPCMGVGMGWTQGSMHGVRWDLRSRSGAFFFFFYFFFFKNDTLFSFQSRTEDLTHNVRGLCP